MQCKKNFSIFLEDLKRAILNPGFVMGILGLTILLMRTIWHLRKTPGTIPIMEICSLPMALSGFTIFSAAFPAWAYAAQFYKEEKTQYSYFILSRMSWKRYISMRLFSVGLSGFLIMAVPLGITFCFSYQIGTKEMGTLFQDSQVWDFIVKQGFITVLCIKTCLGGLFGIFWAFVGFLSSLLVKNKYSPFLIPFILNQFFWILFLPYPTLNPVFLVRGEDLDSYGLSALLLILYCGIAALITILLFRRKVIK